MDCRDLKKIFKSRRSFPYNFVFFFILTFTANSVNALDSLNFSGSSDINGPQKQLEKMYGPEVTLLHSVPSEVIDDWENRYLAYFEKQNEVPKSWFQFSDMGLWFVGIPKRPLSVDIGYCGKEGVEKYSYYRGHKPIIFLANLKPSTGWYLQTEKNFSVWSTWLKKNGTRTNEFSPDVVRQLKEYDVPTHSEFYKDFQLAGFKSMYYIVVNPSVLSETRLLISTPNGTKSIFISEIRDDKSNDVGPIKYIEDCSEILDSLD